MTRATRHGTCRSADPCPHAPPAVRQGSLRRRRRLGEALAGDLDVFRLRSLLALGDVELDLLPFLQAAVAATGDRAEMHEHVLAALDRDEAIAFVAVEPLHSALRHLDLLVVHGRSPAASGSALATWVWPACHRTRGSGNRWLADYLIAQVANGGSRMPSSAGLGARPGQLPSLP